MGQEKNKDISRKSFLNFFLEGKKPVTEKVKMLTPDGKLVEVDKSVIEAALKNKKATNKEIYEWMQNPSKG